MRVATKRGEVGFGGGSTNNVNAKKMHKGSDGKQHGERESCTPCERSGGVGGRREDRVRKRGEALAMSEN